MNLFSSSTVLEHSERTTNGLGPVSGCRGCFWTGRDVRIAACGASMFEVAIQPWEFVANSCS